MAEPEIKICFDLADMVWEGAEFIVQRAAEAIRDHGRFSLALSGGSTPLPMFALMALPEWRIRIDWTKTHVFWADERCVPPNHQDSNYRMAYISLLSPARVPLENIHRIRGEIDPVEAADAYDADLRAYFGGESDDYETRFDVVMLGMGADGHTASLFPGTAALHERTRHVMAHYVDKVRNWRVTLTPPAINAATNVAFLVGGVDKAERLREVLHGDYRPDALPAQIVRPAAGRLIWFVDKDAARLLEQ